MSELADLGGWPALLTELVEGRPSILEPTREQNIALARTKLRQCHLNQPAAVLQLGSFTNHSLLIGSIIRQ